MLLLTNWLLIIFTLHIFLINIYPLASPGFIIIYKIIIKNFLYSILIAFLQYQHPVLPIARGCWCKLYRSFIRDVTDLCRLTISRIVP